MEQLSSPISREEISTALRSTKNGKTPGLDGLPYEFYKKFQDTLEEHLVDVYNWCLREKGSLTATQKQALISLIPKNDDVGNLDNWRPISLQNCDAKILSKVLSSRLQKVLPDLISPSQVCAVPGRQIQHHTLLIREAIALAKHRGTPLYILSLDQEKAFDRVDWGFMFAAFRKLGLPETFVKYVEVFYNGPTSAINVNGHIMPFFMILRGVRQVCPLSILLYVLFAEALAEAIRECRGVEGFVPPGLTDELKVIHYADDTNSLLLNTNSIYELFEILERCQRASGAKLKVSKTKGIAVNHPRGRPLVPEIPIQWNRDDTKILGIIFTGDLAISARLNWQRVYCKIVAKLRSLADRALSCAGRAQIPNSLVLSKAWHVGRVFLPKPYFSKRILKLCCQYIMGGEHETVRREILHLPLDRGGLNFLPMVKQCIALQISDLLRIKSEEEPPWCAFARYWIGDRVKGLLDRWGDIVPNTRPKHVTGKKPKHFELLTLHMCRVLPDLDGKAMPTKVIRGALLKAD